MVFGNDGALAMGQVRCPRAQPETIDMISEILGTDVPARWLGRDYHHKRFTADAYHS
jgi:hypothetical protein